MNRDDIINSFEPPVRQIEQLVDYIDDIIYIARQSDTLDLLWAVEKFGAGPGLDTPSDWQSKACTVHPRGSLDPDFDAP
jgi:Mg2+ and Co2+ transporter CorA